MKILVGADPEVFVQDKSGNLICAHGMVEGTKQAPQPVECGAVQVDGMALEFNINPASTRKEFIDNVNTVMSELHGMIGFKDYDLLTSPTVIFPQDVMDAAHPLAKMLGCEPDYNAHTDGIVNPPPDGSTNMRTAAGHIHVGWTDNADLQSDEHSYNCIDMIKQLDCALGIQSLFWDEDTQRRKMYGQAGAFRPKPYGVEYRVLSNAWLRSEELATHVYNLTVKAAQDFFNGTRYYDEVDAAPIINENNVKQAVWAAKRLEKSYSLPVLEYMHV